MEHYLAPEGTEPIDIPYIGSLEYDGGDFLTYPQRKGWSENELNGEQSFGNRSPAEVEAFFQAWLYFGCLISVFAVIGVEVKTSDFIRETDTREKFITTSQLTRLLQGWVDKEMLKEEFEKQLHSEHPQDLDELIAAISLRENSKKSIDAIVHRVEYFVQKYCSAEAQERAETFKNAPPFWPISPRIAMSIMAVAEPLSRVAGKIYDGSGLAMGKWGSSSFLNERMQDAGWCPREIPIFDINTSIDSAYYFASYQCPDRMFHHEECTKQQCHAKNVDVSRYQTRHVTEECDCAFEPAPEEVKKLVKANQIPIVSWRDGKLTVEKYDDQAEVKTKYVAISHVWSDGMGNETQNALPRCQLTRLQSIVDQLYTEEHINGRGGSRTMSRNASADGVNTKGLSADSQVGFWMDTLCVPLPTDYRKAAIGHMADIYRSADRVVVLDSFIQGLPRSADVMEKYARIWLSNWHRRLWTLQEGLLGKTSVLFQFKDGALTIRDMDGEVAKYSEISVQNLYSSVRMNCAMTLDPFYDWFQVLGSKVSSSGFFTWAYGIRGRSTSKVEDEPICFSTLVGLDPRPVLKCVAASGESLAQKRMECFYEQVKHFDARIVFNEFPRLQKHGYRWAPRSFIGHFYNPFPGPERKGIQQAALRPGGGLEVSLAGIKLKGIGAHLGTTIYVVTGQDSSRWYSVTIRPDAEGAYPTWDPTSQYMIPLHTHVRRVGDAAEAILGIFDGKEDSGRIRIQHVSRAHVEVVDRGKLKILADSFFEGKADFEGVEGFNGQIPVWGRWLKTDQTWCVL